MFKSNHTHNFMTQHPSSSYTGRRFWMLTTTRMVSNAGVYLEMVRDSNSFHSLLNLNFTWTLSVTFFFFFLNAVSSAEVVFACICSLATYRARGWEVKHSSSNCNVLFSFLFASLLCHSLIFGFPLSYWTYVLVTINVFMKHLSITQFV